MRGERERGRDRHCKSVARGSTSKQVPGRRAFKTEARKSTEILSVPEA